MTSFTNTAIPKGWVSTTLENVCEVVAGNPAPQGKEFFENGTFNFVRVRDMGRLGDKTYLSETNDKVNKRAISKLRQFPKGSVLFTKSGASTLNNQRAILGQDSYVVSHIAIAISNEGISNKWIYFFLKRIDFGDLAHSSVMPSLPLSKIKPLQILIPPTKEQHRIVAKIEELFSEVDKGVENLQTARAQLKVYRQALLKHAFEGKLTAQWRAENQGKLETAATLQKRIQQERAQRYQQQLADWEAAGKQGGKPRAPKAMPPLSAEELAALPELTDGWGWLRLASIVTVLSGYAFKSSDFISAGIPVIKIANVGYSEFIDKDQQFLGQTFLEHQKDYVIAPNDLLLALTRPITNNRTKVCRYPKDAPLALLNQRVASMKDSEIDHKFLYAYLGTSLFKESIRSKFSETLQPNLSPKDLEACPVPICSIEEQAHLVCEIESRLSVIDQLDQTITTSLQQAEALRQSILKKAFSGRLVPQDPQDEPASALLARIKAEKMLHTQESKKSLARGKRNE